MIKPRRRRLPAGFWPAQIRPNRSWVFSPVALAVAAALLAALLMPQQSPFPFRFEKGHPWNYPTLKAPFDFEVLYPEDQVREQLDRVDAEHAPYYAVRPEVARQQKRFLAEQINEQVKISRNDTQFADLIRNPGAYTNFGQQLLDAIYARGLGGTELEGLYNENPNAPIYLVNGKNQQRTLVSALLTPRRAQDFLTDTLPYCPLRQPEILLPLLEKSLLPNVVYSDSLTAAGKRQKIAAIVSTGLTVRKGDVIVQRNESVSTEIFLKLDSLRGRFDAPNGMRVLAGYAVLAFFTFGLFFYWLQKERPEIWENRNLRLLLPAALLVTILLVATGCRLGPAVALLIPIWGLPVVLDRTFGPIASGIAWMVVTLLTTFSLEWSAGWLALQVSGAAGVRLLHWHASGWKARSLAAVGTALFQILVWAACWLAGKFPAGLQTTDVILFLLAANGLMLLSYPLSRILTTVRTTPH